MSFLDFLRSRFSCGSLIFPAPDQEQVHQILSVAMCAPDHGRLRPWRFIVITDAYRQQWLATLQEVMTKVEYDYPLTYVNKVTKNFSEAPLIFGLGMRKITENTSVSIDEQLMAVSAAVMNMLNAVHALNFGAKWITGPIANQELVAALGMPEPYRMLGFMFVGTPETGSRAPKRAVVDDYVAVWKGKPVQFKADS